MSSYNSSYILWLSCYTKQGVNEMTEEALYNWLQSRSSGVQLPIFSLPSSTGIGNFGSSAYRFVDFLKRAPAKRLLLS